MVYISLFSRQCILKSVLDKIMPSEEPSFIITPVIVNNVDLIQAPKYRVVTLDGLTNVMVA